jgi:hypothetical protein
LALFNDHALNAAQYQWQMETMKKLMEQESDATFRDMHIAQWPSTPTTATEMKIRMEEKERKFHERYGGRSHGKSATLGQFQKTITGRWSNTVIVDDLRSNGGSKFSIPRGLFQGEHGSLLMVHDKVLPKAPTNTIQDRQYLQLSIPEYQNFAEAVQSSCFLNREGNHYKVKNAKTKKLKNLRHKIKNSEFLLQSMIWKAQLHVIQAEIDKRQKVSQGIFS